jgi:hypothetical protein
VFTPTRCTPFRTTFAYAGLLIAALTVNACGDTSGPTSRSALAPTRGTVNASDNSTWTPSTVVTDVTYFVPCLGESLHLYGLTFIEQHQTTSSSGNLQTHIHLLPQTPNLPPFTATGVSTGRVFTYSNGHPINIIIILGPGQVFTAVDKELYHASDGTDLYFVGQIHFTVNANGVVTVNRDNSPGTWTCK